MHKFIIVNQHNHQHTLAVEATGIIIANVLKIEIPQTLIWAQTVIREDKRQRQEEGPDWKALSGHETGAATEWDD